jgi:hypothetical protein
MAVIVNPEFAEIEALEFGFGGSVAQGIHGQAVSLFKILHPFPITPKRIAVGDFVFPIDNAVHGVFIVGDILERVVHGVFLPGLAHNVKSKIGGGGQQDHHAQRAHHGQHSKQSDEICCCRSKQHDDNRNHDDQQGDNDFG